MLLLFPGFLRPLVYYEFHNSLSSGAFSMAVLMPTVAGFFLILAKAKFLTPRGLYAVYTSVCAGFRCTVCSNAWRG